MYKRNKLSFKHNGTTVWIDQQKGLKAFKRKKYPC